MKIYLLGVLFKRICPTAHTSVKLAKTAVTEWQAVNVGLTRVNLNASVKRVIMGKVYNTSVQRVHQGHTNLKVLQEESVRAFHVLMKITPLHLEAQPPKTVSAGRGTGHLARPVKLSTVLL